MVCAGAVTDLVFLGLHRVFGVFTFVIFCAISAAGGVYVYRNVPETKGKQLQEVQALIKGLHPDAGAVCCALVHQVLCLRHCQVLANCNVCWVFVSSRSVLHCRCERAAGGSCVLPPCYTGKPGF
jgi:hypothetical protein